MVSSAEAEYQGGQANRRTPDWQVEYLGIVGRRFAPGCCSEETPNAQTRCKFVVVLTPFARRRVCWATWKEAPYRLKTGPSFFQVSG